MARLRDILRGWGWGPADPRNILKHSRILMLPQGAPNRFIVGRDQDEYGNN